MICVFARGQDTDTQRKTLWGHREEMAPAAKEEGPEDPARPHPDLSPQDCEKINSVV